VSRHLLRHGVKNLMISNRTLARTEMLIKKLEGNNIQALTLEQLPLGLNQADIVITSTASPSVLITRKMVESAQQQRRYHPMLIVDIAVPRDVEESVNELDAVYHYTVDDLHNIIQRNLSEREKASRQAERIIQQECDDYFEWLKVHQFSALIRNYRDNAEQIRQQLLEKSVQSLQQGESAEQVLQQLSYKLMNKLIHSPTQAMQTMVKNGDAKGLRAFSTALGVEDTPPL
jgi:glutamyl-tRNA reductase